MSVTKIYVPVTWTGRAIGDTAFPAGQRGWNAALLATNGAGVVRTVEVDDEDACRASHVFYLAHEDRMPGGCRCVRCGAITDADRAVRDMSAQDILDSAGH